MFIVNFDVLDIRLKMHRQNLTLPMHFSESVLKVVIYYAHTHDVYTF